MTDTLQAIVALKDRDTSKSAEEQGLFRKFEIRRTDGSDGPGGKHEDCEYFVIDATHDAYAKAALSAYADACEATHPDLARDMRERYTLAQPDGAVAWKCVKRREDDGGFWTDTQYPETERELCKMQNEGYSCERIYPPLTRPAPSEAVEWRPIESAPRDGTRILGLTSFGVEPVKWHPRNPEEYAPGDGWIGTEQDSACFPISWDGRPATGQPSKWMPLPLSPTQGASRDRD
jgi:hypothetical protein